MGFIVSTTTAACLTVCCIFTSTTAAQADDTKYNTTIVLAQRGKTLGDVVVYASPTAIRVDNAHTKITLVAKAPEWSVNKFCLSTRRYTHEPYSGFVSKLNRMHALFGGIILNSATATKVANCQIFGYAGEDYKEDQDFAKKGYEMYYVSKVVNGDYPQEFKYRILNPETFPKEEAHILCVMHGVPDLKGIPISMRCKSYDLHTYNLLTTSSIQPASVTKSQFDLPAGLKEVQEESQLTTDADTESALIHMMGGDKYGK